MSIYSIHNAEKFVSCQWDDVIRRIHTAAMYLITKKRYSMNDLYGNSLWNFPLKWKMKEIIIYTNWWIHLVTLTQKLDQLCMSEDGLDTWWKWCESCAANTRIFIVIVNDTATELIFSYFRVTFKSFCVGIWTTASNEQQCRWIKYWKSSLPLLCQLKTMNFKRSALNNDSKSLYWHQWRLYRQ